MSQNIRRDNIVTKSKNNGTIGRVLKVKNGYAWVQHGIDGQFIEPFKLAELREMSRHHSAKKIQRAFRSWPVNAIMFQRFSPSKLMVVNKQTYDVRSLLKYWETKKKIANREGSQLQLLVPHAKREILKKDFPLKFIGNERLVKLLIQRKNDRRHRHSQ